MIRPSERDGMHVLYNNFYFEKTEIFFIPVNLSLDAFPQIRIDLPDGRSVLINGGFRRRVDGRGPSPRDDG